MRKVIMSCVVLALILVSANQASAINWRTRWQRTGYRNSYCYTAPAVLQDAQVSSTAAPITVVESDVQMKQSVALESVVDAIRGMLKREHERLQWELDCLDQDEDGSSSYGSD